MLHLIFLAALLPSLLPVDETLPNRQPALASVPRLTAVVFGSGNSIWISTSVDDAHSFSQPTEVARVPALALGRHRGPRVAIVGSTLIVTAVYGNKKSNEPHSHGLPVDGDLVAWRSTDGGHTWQKPVVINDVPGAAREGLHAFAAASQGELVAVWLDLRRPGTRLVGAYSKDSGETWSPNRLLYESPGGSICQCCAPSVAVEPSGRAVVMFRNLLEGARDMYSLKWQPGNEPSQPEKMGTASWVLNACPMDGGGVGVENGAVTGAWRRDKTVYLGEPGQPEKAVGEGKDVAFAIGKRSLYVAWTSASGIQLFSSARQDTRPVSMSGSFAALTPLANG